MTGVVPAWKILEVLNEPELAEQRKLEEEIMKQEHEGPKAVFDTATNEETQTTPEGIEIPIPATDQFFSDLEKASRKKE